MKHCEECASQEGRFANICIFAACPCHLLAHKNNMDQEKLDTERDMQAPDWPNNTPRYDD